MKKVLAMVLFAGIVFGVSTAYGDETAVEGTAVAEDGQWATAGSEMSEAAHAVGDATADSSRKAWNATKEGSVEAWDATKKGSAKAWESTKKGSAEAWDATKEKSNTVWEEGKAKVHEATAPEPAKPEGD